VHHIGTLLAFLANHPGPAYGAVFLISLSESLALIGLLVPGTVLMFGIGELVSRPVDSHDRGHHR
jgi:membrane protein DedA with SNARE-associated domain